MAKAKKKATKKDELSKISESFKDAINLSIQPPPKAITPPEETPKKAGKKK